MVINNYKYFYIGWCSVFFDEMLIKRKKTACFLGEKRMNRSAMIYSVADELLKSGIDSFIFSADTFFCLESAMQVILRKKKQCGNVVTKIKLTGVIPYETHVDFRAEEYRNMYFDVLEKCDEIICFDEEERFVAADFSEFILNRSSILVCPEKGAEYEKLYAAATGIKIIGIP